jgi:pyrimidine deaminase RibD-like protein
MERAIALARQCESEQGRVSPKVGAVVARDGVVIGEAFRGELAPGDHAEFTLLEEKLGDKTLAGATLFTTLEPCTVRNKPKLACAERIIERRIARVVFGVATRVGALLTLPESQSCTSPQPVFEFGNCNELQATASNPPQPNLERGSRGFRSHLNGSTDSSRPAKTIVRRPTSRLARAAPRRRPARYPTTIWRWRYRSKRNASPRDGRRRNTGLGPLGNFAHRG